MWIFTENGFVSIVADPLRQDRAILRAHRLEHIRALVPDAEIWQISSGERGDRLSADDYHYRAVVKKQAVIAAVSAQVESLEFGTFRERISDPVYYDACNRARVELYALDRTLPPRIFIDQDGEQK